MLPEFAQTGTFPATAGFGAWSWLGNQAGEMRADKGGDGLTMAEETEAAAQFIGHQLKIGWLLQRDKLRWTPFFSPLSAENKMDSCGLLSSLVLSVCGSLCALKPIGKERTSRAWHCPSPLSLFFGCSYLLPQAV